MRTSRPSLLPALLLLGALACRSRPPESEAAGPASRDTTPAPAAAGPSASPEGVAWTLLAVGGRAATAEGTPTLQLDPAAHRASGDAGCNRFSGTYALAGDSLRFGPLMSTKRACADAARTAQETAYLGALEATRTWAVAGDTLRLAGERGETARLVRRP